MGISLNGLTPAGTYASLLKFGDNSAITSSLKVISDGAGNDLPICVSTTSVGINTTTGSALFNIKGTGSTSATSSFLVQNSTGTSTIVANDETNVFFGKAIKVGGSNSFYNTSGYIAMQNGGNNARIGPEFFSTDSGSWSATVLNGGPTLNMSVFGWGSFNQNLSVGLTTAPSSRLHVKGSGSTSATTSLLVQNSAGTQGLKVLDDTTSYFGDSATTVNYVSQFYGSLNVYGWTSSGTIMNFPNASNSAITYANGPNALYLKSGMGNLIFQTNGATDRMTIDSSGNVGIGLTPNAKLSLKGNGTSYGSYGLRVADSTNTTYFYTMDDKRVVVTGGANLVMEGNISVQSSYGLIFPGATSWGRIQADGSGVRIYDNGSGYAGLKVDATNGKVSINSYSTPTSNLTITGSGTTSATSSLLVQNSSGTTILQTVDSGLLGIGGGYDTRTLPARMMVSPANSKVMSIGYFAGGSVPATLNDGDIYTFSGGLWLNSQYSSPSTKGLIYARMKLSGLQSDFMYSSGWAKDFDQFNSSNWGTFGWGSLVHTGYSYGNTVLGYQPTSVGVDSRMYDGFLQSVNGNNSYDPCAQLYVDIKGSIFARGVGSYAETDWKKALTDNANKTTTVGSETNYASAKFAVDSTTKGFLPPRMTTTEKNAISTPAAGLVVYDTTTNKLCCYNGSIWNDLF